MWHCSLLRNMFLALRFVIIICCFSLYVFDFVHLHCVLVFFPLIGWLLVRVFHPFVLLRLLFRLTLFLHFLISFPFVLFCISFTTQSVRTVFISSISAVILEIAWFIVCVRELLNKLGVLSPSYHVFCTRNNAALFLLLQRGDSCRSIAKMVGCGLASVSDTIKRHAETDSLTTT